MNETAGAIEQDVIMTLSEVAEYLKMGPSTVYRLARQGVIPGRKIGGTWRFSRRVIDAWIKEQEIPPTTGEHPKTLVADINPDTALTTL